MQEIKNKIRVAAAALAGGLMLGATMAGAFAANLGELPAPFVVNNNMAGQIVVGASATVPDVIAAAQISAALGQYMVSASSSSAATGTQGYKEEDLALNSVVSSTIGTTLTDTQIAKLQDKQINFRSTNYDIHEAIILGGSDPVLVTGVDSSTMSGVQDGDTYGTSVGGKTYVKITEGGLRYRYIFDDTLNATATSTLVDSDHPLTLSLLGQSMKVVSVSQSANTITVQLGTSAVLGDGQSTTVGDYTVTVDTIGSNSVALSISGGGCSDSDFVSKSDTWDTTCGDIKVEVEDILYVDAASPSNKAKLRIGSETSKTYTHGDNYVTEDEDDSNPTWKWDINVTGGVINYLGAYYAKDVNSMDDDPISVGEEIAFPNDYVVLKLKNYNTETRGTYEFKFDSSEDLYASSVATTPTEDNVPVFIVDGPADDAFTYSGTESEKLAFYQESDGKATETFKTAYWDNDNNKWVLSTVASNVTSQTTLNWVLNYQDTTYNLYVVNTSAGAAVDNYAIVLADGTYDTIKIALHDGTTGFDYLGSTDNQADAAELAVGSTNIGTAKTDILTHYGTIIKNPDTQGDGDKVTLEVPAEQVKMYVYAGAPTTSTSTTSDIAYTYTGLTSEVAVLDIEATTTVPMIIVGGPYANSLARTLIGSDDATIEEFFGYDATAETGKGIVKLYDSSETTWGVDALLVAGWSADDTRAAAYILGKYLTGAKSLSALSGKTKIAVTATDATTISNEEVE